MLCKHSDNCSYYRTFRYQQNSKQYQLLVESYCEGTLRASCHRLKYVDEFGTEPPAELAPNGYLAGTHKKLRIENTRKHKRYKVKNGVCLLQVLGSPKTFSAWVVDISEGGMQLELNVAPQDLDISPKSSKLKILGYSIDEVPFPLTKDILNMVWQKNQAFGCAFAASA